MKLRSIVGMCAFWPAMDRSPSFSMKARIFMTSNRNAIALSFLAQAAAFRQCSISTENRIAMICERLLIEASDAGYLKKIRISQEDIDLRKGKISKRRGSTMMTFLFPGYLFYCLAGYREVTVEHLENVGGEFLALSAGAVSVLMPIAFPMVLNSEYGFCSKDEEAFDEIRMYYALACELLAAEINPPSTSSVTSSGGRKAKRSDFQIECIELLKTMSADDIDILMINDRPNAWAYYKNKRRNWETGDAKRTQDAENELIRREKKPRIDS